MKRMLFLLLAWILAMSAMPALAADPLDGVVPLVKDDLTAVAQIKATPERHVLLFFGDQLN
jgi:hypothetical protein